MADKMLIDGLIKFCDEKSKNIKLKAEPQVFIEIKQALEELKNLKPSKKGFITIGQTVEEFEKEIRTKAINEFAERLNKRLHCAFSDDLEIQKYVNEIAEEMRGEENE